MSKKMSQCKACGAEIAKSAKSCPQCGAKNKKPIFKRWWFWAIIIVLVISIAASGGDDTASGEPTPTISEEEFKAACQEPNYKDLLRYSSDHRGDKVVVEALLSQEVSDGKWRAYSGGSILGDEYYIEDVRADDDLKILVDDVVLVYGTYNGVKEITRALTGTTDEVPWIKAEYIELIIEGGEDITVDSNPSPVVSASTQPEPSREVEQSSEPEKTPEPTPTPEPTTQMTTGQKNALRSANSYLRFSAFSHSGLINQLEFEGYSTEDATFAADNCGADWNEQALKSAKSYLDFSAFSYTGLINQLEFEGFTTAQATYGADNCGADWFEQAAKSAESYLEFTAFSRDGLIGQLEFEGFTHEQAVYGAEQVGY